MPNAEASTRTPATSAPRPRSRTAASSRSSPPAVAAHRDLKEARAAARSTTTGAPLYLEDRVCSGAAAHGDARRDRDRAELAAAHFDDVAGLASESADERRIAGRAADQDRP